MQASEILTQASDLLFDETNVRWPETELLRWMTAAQRQIVLHRPDAYAINQSVQLVAGTKQSLPSNGIRLLRVVRNMGSDGSTPGRAIRWIDQDIMDAHVPAWHTETAATAVKHAMTDERDPKNYYVYPPVPASPQVHVEIIFSSEPSALTDGTDTIAIDSIYAGPILDFVLFRAFAKDTGHTVNERRSLQHLNHFHTALGVKSNIDLAMAPENNQDTPNTTTIR